MAIQTDSAAALRWLNRESPRIDEVEAGLKRIGRNSERANGVIQRVRAFHVRDESIHAEFDLNQAVLEVVSLTRLEQRAADVEVEEDLAAGLGPAHGDRVQILQVIVNMLVNAIQALRPVSDRPRRITLRTRGDQSGMLRVQVEDNGVGLDPSIAGRLFEPYFTTRKGGTGLGLAISRSIIDSHRGRIWAEPAPDRGTVFQFTIPEAIRAPGDPPS
jgi:signal transduction histidine kinase